MMLPPPTIDSNLNHPDIETNGDNVSRSANLEDHPKCASSSTQTMTGGKQIMSIENLKNQPNVIKYYTGFLDYEHFLYFFSCLGPAAYCLSFQSGCLSAQDELFLTLMKLRQGKDDEELGYLFDISRTLAAKIFRTWLNFLYFQLKELDIWLPKEVILENMPSDFRKKYPHTRVILDATEIGIQKPQNLHDQSATWSSYKNKNTLKCIVGISPRGFVTYISDTYGGSASDRQIIERSEFVQSNTMFVSGDSIMADRGIMVQDLFACQNVQVNTPTTMKGKNQLPSKTVVKDRRIASKRVHVERVIGLAKTFKILKRDLNHMRTPLGGRIIYVCFAILNFRPCIVGERA
jgi:hypothetical protein